MNILLTGGAGFIGSAVTRQLIAQGGLRVDGERVVDPKFELTPGNHAVRAGKTKWARMTVRTLASLGSAPERS